MTSSQRTSAAAILALALATPAALGATRTWDGEAEDGLYLTELNWVGDIAPEDNDFRDTARFDATADSETITLPAGHEVFGINFDTAGWTITGGSFANLSNLTSAGDGTNYLDTTVNLRGNRTWNVASGNTLRLESLYIRNHNLTITGGGTFRLDNALTGFGGGTFGIVVGNATFQADSTSLFGNVSSGSTITLNDSNAIFDMAGTVGTAQSRINNGRILAGAGFQLQVADRGDGYARITTAPVDIPISPIAVGFNQDGDFEITFRGLDTTKTYQLFRGGDLLNFGEPAGTPKQPVEETDGFSDSEPPAGKAFYILEEVQEP